MGATVKISVTLDRELAEEARGRAGGNLSAFVNEALAHELRRERMREYLAAEREELGELPAELLADVRRKWPD